MYTLGKENYNILLIYFCTKSKIYCYLLVARVKILHPLLWVYYKCYQLFDDLNAVTGIDSSSIMLVALVINTKLLSYAQTDLIEDLFNSSKFVLY